MRSRRALPEGLYRGDALPAGLPERLTEGGHYDMASGSVDFLNYPAAELPLDQVGTGQRVRCRLVRGLRPAGLRRRRAAADRPPWSANAAVLAFIDVAGCTAGLTLATVSSPGGI